MGADCKSAGASLRRFESFPLHHILCGSSSVGRASAFQAECRGFESRLPLHGAAIAQLVEHVLGKDEVASSILAGSSKFIKYVINFVNTTRLQLLNELWIGSVCSIGH